MSKKSVKIAALIEGCQGKDLDPHYLGYFECFNRELYYEAHDVLEELWLARRKQPNDLFFKGLIQFAGAFVHLQKNRLKPAAALFKLARSNISIYPSPHEGLNTKLVREMIEQWLERLQASNFLENPLHNYPPPILSLTGDEKDGKKTAAQEQNRTGVSHE